MIDEGNLIRRQHYSNSQIPNFEIVATAWSQRTNMYASSVHLPLHVCSLIVLTKG